MYYMFENSRGDYLIWKEITPNRLQLCAVPINPSGIILENVEGKERVIDMSDSRGTLSTAKKSENIDDLISEAILDSL